MKKVFDDIVVCIPNDKQAVKHFINAVVNDKPDDAKQYLSKKLMSGEIVDLSRLRGVVEDCKDFKILNFCYGGLSAVNRVTGKVDSNVSDSIINGKCKNSVLIMGKNKQSILHLYMIREPDQYSSWKIYGIENEGDF